MASRSTSSRMRASAWRCARGTKRPFFHLPTERKVHMTVSIQESHEISRRARVDEDLEIRRVGGNIGAEIRGIRLAADLDESTIQEIRRALVRHKVIFFRGQQHLDDAAHEDFAARFGGVIAHPTVPVREGSRYLLELDTTEGRA